MAAAALTPAEKAAGLDGDLQFIMAGLDIEIDHQAAAYDRQLKSVRMFATVADTRADARARVRLLWGIDLGAHGLSQQEAITRMAAEIKLVACWESCRNRTEERDKIEALRALSNQPVQFSHNEFKGRRGIFEQVFRKLEDDEAPAKSYLEALETRIGDSDFKAERLVEVITEDEDIDDGAPDMAFNRETGTFKPVSKKKLGKVPTNAEELRQMLKVLGHAWCYMKLSHQNRGWLQSMSPEVIRLHTEHILGKEVLGMESFNEAGKTCCQPPWPLVLAYEFRLRKYALEAARDRKVSIADGYVEARKDRDHRDKYFINPLRLNHPSSIETTTLALWEPTANSGRSAPYQAPQGKDWQDKGKGKGKGKGKSKDKKGKFKKEKVEDLPYFSKMHEKTPDGKPICRTHNHPRMACTYGKACRFVHCCSICFETSHNAATCAKRL